MDLLMEVSFFKSDDVDGVESKDPKTIDPDSDRLNKRIFICDKPNEVINQGRMLYGDLIGVDVDAFLKTDKKQVEWYIEKFKKEATGGRRKLRNAESLGIDPKLIEMGLMNWVRYRKKMYMEGKLLI